MPAHAPDDPFPRRDFGRTWQSRLAEARARATHVGPRLSDDEVASLRRAVSTLDVSCAEHAALFWSGKDVPTVETLHERDEGGPMWLDKYATQEAAVLRALALATSVEDTPADRYLLSLGLHYPEDDPLAHVVRELWDALSARFARAARGRVEVLAEGALADGVFRTVELGALLLTLYVEDGVVGAAFVGGVAGLDLPTVHPGVEAGPAEARGDRQDAGFVDRVVAAEDADAGRGGHGAVKESDTDGSICAGLRVRRNARGRVSSASRSAVTCGAALGARCGAGTRRGRACRRHPSNGLSGTISDAASSSGGASRGSRRRHTRRRPRSD